MLDLEWNILLTLAALRSHSHAPQYRTATESSTHFLAEKTLNHHSSPTDRELGTGAGHGLGFWGGSESELLTEARYTCIAALAMQPFTISEPLQAAGQPAAHQITKHPPPQQFFCLPHEAVIDVIDQS